MVKLFVVNRFCTGTCYDKIAISNIKMDLTMRNEIPRWSIMTNFNGCCRPSPTHKRNKTLVEKGLKRLEKELDILNILPQLRMLKMSYQVSQTGVNRKIIESLSKKVLSSAGSGSSDQDSDEKHILELERKRIKSEIAKVDPYGEISSEEEKLYIDNCMKSNNQISKNLIKVWKNYDDERV